MNWLKYKKIYFTISLLFITVGIFSLFSWGLNLGVDFKGGSIAEYEFANPISEEEISQDIRDAGLELSTIQATGANQYIFRLSALTPEQRQDLERTVNERTEGEVSELRFETVGPSIGPELVKKTIYAVAIASFAILLWVAIQFKSIYFGGSAVLAMLHDSFILIGSFSFLGHFLGAEVDFLFVTALLTTLSFSVHDTIVVYDRIREKQNKSGGNLEELANSAITETMVRSLNNSFTIIFMLFALILLGGSTIKWFAVALFIGTVLGTYSSPFVAVPLLVTLNQIRYRVGK